LFFFVAPSLEVSDIEASDASAAIAAEASAPNGSFITSFGVIYITSAEGAISVSLSFLDGVHVAFIIKESISYHIYIRYAHMQKYEKTLIA
jgi:hypothetical protein